MLRKLCFFQRTKCNSKVYCIFCRLPRLRILNLNFIIFLLLLITVIVYLFYYNVFCSTWQVTAAVNLLCGLYAKGEIAGNLCHDLCVSGVVRLGSCQTQHSAKEVVFEAIWNDAKIVVKSEYLELKKYDTIGFKTSSNEVQYPTLAEFTEIAANHVRINLNVSLNSENVLSTLWTEDLDRLTLQSSNSIMNSIWSLIQQNEYILMKCFENEKVFPKVIGSCGHFYAVEYLDPLKVYNWSCRLLSALKLVDLSRKLDHNFNQPLHLCDVKFNHFGIDSEMNIRVLDADTSYFKPVIDKMVSNGKQCDTDADCSFWDCRSKCDSEKKICNKEVLNNNLQVICERIFLGHSSHSLILKPFENGLLNHPPDSNKNSLLSLLKDCATLKDPLTQNTNLNISRMLKLYFEQELQKLS